MPRQAESTLLQQVVVYIDFFTFLFVVIVNLHGTFPPRSGFGALLVCRPDNISPKKEGYTS